MNNFFCFLVGFGAILSAQAQNHDLAIRYPAKIEFHVLTDEGHPASFVDVSISTFLRWQKGEGFGHNIYQKTAGRTSGEGLAVLDFTAERPDFTYGIYDAPGYYPTRNLAYRFHEVKEGRWLPWNPVIDVVLKPIVKPIPMYARKVGGITDLLELPVVNQPVGYDLMVADWVQPHGQGRVADLILTLHELIPRIDVRKLFSYKLEISFSNPADGIQSVLAPPFSGSDLRLPRYAPETGYIPRLEKQLGRPLEGKPISSGTREDQNYFYRVRTVLDEKGRIVSALYGKIAGDFSCDVINSPKGYIAFRYYLNPTPLDRNMEFDPKRNLFTNLSSLEEVNEP